MENTITLGMIENYAENQDVENPTVSFLHNGTIIINPFVDETCRYKYTLEESMAEYGVENVTDFINNVIAEIVMQSVIGLDTDEVLSFGDTVIMRVR